MLEKLVAFVIIVIAVVALWLIRVFDPPAFVQIICAFVGTIICLVGIVVVFSEGSIFAETRRVKKDRVPVDSKTSKGTAT